MKKYILFVYTVFAFLFVACSGSKSDSHSPGEVAVTLYNAITSGDTLAMKEHLYISNRQQRNVFFKYYAMAVSSPQYKQNIENFTPSYQVVEEKIDGDEADVVLSGKNPLGQNVRIMVRLLKVDDVWKVDGDHGVWHK